MKSSRYKHSKTSSKSDEADLNTCALCFGPKGNEEDFGKFFQSEESNLAVHQFCLLFSSGLAQNGDDNEGFDGFLPKDIRLEVKRASRLKCSKCHKPGATIGCCISKCRRSFHFFCGVKVSNLYQFFGNFRVFCKEHRPHQNQTVKTGTQLCPICLSDIDILNQFESISSPCCKNSWFHRTCVQKQALVSGSYFFRCALCNNLEDFQKEMNQMGIYIPERDAMWEQGNAYADLLQEYNKCDSETCVCPKGREFSGEHKGNKWEIFLCYACGQSGTHLQCKGWNKMPTQWLCSDCDIILINTESKANGIKTAELSQDSDTSSEDEIPLSTVLSSRGNMMNTANKCKKPVDKDLTIYNSSLNTSSITNEEGILLNPNVLESKCVDSNASYTSQESGILEVKNKDIISRRYRAKDWDQRLKRKKRRARYLRREKGPIASREDKAQVSMCMDQQPDENNFSLSLDVSVELDPSSSSEQSLNISFKSEPDSSAASKYSPDLDVKLDRDASSSYLRDTQNSTILLKDSNTPSENPPKKVTSSPKDLDLKTSTKEPQRQDLCTHLFSDCKQQDLCAPMFSDRKNGILDQWGDDVIASQNPKKSPGIKQTIKKQKLDNHGQRSITSYMTINPNHESLKRKKRESLPTSTISIDNSRIPSQTQPNSNKFTISGWSSSCLEGAKSIFNRALKKIHYLDDVHQTDPSSKTAVNTSLLTEDSDTDSSGSIQIVKVTKKEPPSKANIKPASDLVILIDEDSDDQDSGKGGSRDNSDAGLSYVSSTDSKANVGDIEELQDVELISLDASDIDDGIFVTCDEDDSFSLNCRTSIEPENVKSEKTKPSSNNRGLDISQISSNPRSKQSESKKHKSTSKRQVIKPKKKESTNDNKKRSKETKGHKERKGQRNKKEHKERIGNKEKKGLKQADELNAQTKGENTANIKANSTREQDLNSSHSTDEPNQPMMNEQSKKDELDEGDSPCPLDVVTSPSIGIQTETQTNYFCKKHLFSPYIPSGSSSDESLKPLKKTKRISESPQTKNVSLLKYSECSDEDFKSKKRKDFTLAIKYKQSKKPRRNKKTECSSNIDIISEAPS